MNTSDNTSDTRFSLQNRCAVVFGAATGLGRAISHEYVSAGAQVLGLDIEMAGLDQTQQLCPEPTAMQIARCDVTSEQDCQTAVNEFAAGHDGAGGIDVMVYSVATRHGFETVTEMSAQSWHRDIDINLNGAFHASRAVIPHIAAAGRGSIILVASQLGSVAVAGAPAYCASKGALIQLARALAVDHVDDGIRANSLSPGAVGTERLQQRFGSLDNAQSQLGDKHVVRRIGVADEIVGAARFLASDASQFMTGADLVVDGGYTSV